MNLPSNGLKMQGSPLHWVLPLALSLVLTVVSLLVSLIFVVRLYRSTRLDA